MKKTLHYLLIFSTSFLFSSLNAQELVYEQDHGVSFNKGTIDSDALIAIIQKKQEELNKFVLGRIVTKSWIESGKSTTDSRLNNFTTKYLIYETLNELTVTADKSKFGKNTLELLKEVAIIYGLAVSVDSNYQIKGILVKQPEKLNSKTSATISLAQNQDEGMFNLTLDLVLDICISDPEFSKFFPRLSKLSNANDTDRSWYEKDSRYYPNRDSSNVVKQYQTTRELLTKALHFIEKSWKTIKNPTSEQIWEVVGTVYIEHFANTDIQFFEEIKNIANTLDHQAIPILDSIRKQIIELTSGYGPLEDDFLLNVKKIAYDYDQFKTTLPRTTLFYSKEDIKDLLKHFRENWKDDLRKNDHFASDFEDFETRISNRDWVDKKEVVLWIENLKSENISIPESLNQYLDYPYKKIDVMLARLEMIGARFEMIRSVVLMFHAKSELTEMGGFQFNETQLKHTKELLGKFVSYIEKTGKFNVPAIYLNSLINNITYSDSVGSKPASVSLNFESVLYEINDKLVKPSQLHRTRYIQPYINIGVNYSAFLNPNNLQVNDDGTTSRMNSLAFASEKIGIKFKIWNYQYTRSFQPGVSFKYYNRKGTVRSWNRPQPKPILDDFFVDVHTGGLLYNVVNLKTEENFDFPFVGIGLGCRTFNGITFSGSLNQPYTNNAFNTDNLFFMFSIDIPIIEYITAIRSK